MKKEQKSKRKSATELLPSWDLSDFYDSPSSPKITKDFEKIASEVEKFVKKFQGKLEKFNSAKDASHLFLAISASLGRTFLSLTRIPKATLSKTVMWRNSA